MHLERFLEAARLFQPDGCRPGDGRERDEQLEERHVVQARHRATEGMDERKVLPKCKFHVLSKRRMACRRGAGIAINKFWSREHSLCSLLIKSEGRPTGGLRELKRPNDFSGAAKGVYPPRA